MIFFKSIILATLLAYRAAKDIDIQQLDVRNSQVLVKLCATNDPRYFCCSYIDELYNYRPHLRCGKFDCWSSQMQDQDRYLLYSLFRNLRELVATGKCELCRYPYQDIFIMSYHWYLEYISMNFLNNTCVFSQKPTKVNLDLFPVPKGYLMGNFSVKEFKDVEFVSSSFPLNLTSPFDRMQAQLTRYLFDTPHINILGDWNETDFRRGRAQYFGCSVTVLWDVSGITGVSEEVDRYPVVFLSCVFAAKTALISTAGNATNKTCQEIDPDAFVENPNVCRTDQREEYTKLEQYPCSFFSYGLYNHSKHNCDNTSVPITWRMNVYLDDRMKYQFILMKTGNRKLTLHYEPISTTPPEITTTTTKTTAKTTTKTTAKLTTTSTKISEVPTKSSTSTTQASVPNFAVSPPPTIPTSVSLILLKVKSVNDEKDSKFCTIISLLLSISLAALCLTASLIGIFYIEKKKFNLPSVV